MRTRSDLLVGVLASAGVVVLVSAVVALLKPHVPVLSLGALYVLAVLPVAILWGTALAVVVSVASMLVFNWFFLPPYHSFHLQESQNWLALAVYLVIAVAVGALGARARTRRDDAEQRRAESHALAEAALELLRGRTLDEELGHLASLTAGVLRVEGARLELGEQPPGEGEQALPLEAGLRCVATLFIDGEATVDDAVRRRFLPTLAALLAVVAERSRLEAEALEAEALRRSDALKTALLRAVSHDLRSPLTAILASADALASPGLSLEPEDRLALRRRSRARPRVSTGSSGSSSISPGWRQAPSSPTGSCGTWTSWSARRSPGWEPMPAASAWRSGPRRRRSRSTRPRSSGCSPTSSTTRSTTRRPAPGSSCAPNRERRSCGCTSSTTGPACLPRNGTRCSSRSGVAVQVRSARVSASRSLAASPRRTAGKLWAQDDPGGGHLVLSLPLAESPAAVRA